MWCLWSFLQTNHVITVHNDRWLKKDTHHPTKTKKWREAGYLDGARERGGSTACNSSFHVAAWGRLPSAVCNDCVRFLIDIISISHPGLGDPAPSQLKLRQTAESGHGGWNQKTRQLTEVWRIQTGGSVRMEGKTAKVGWWVEKLGGGCARGRLSCRTCANKRCVFF